MGELKALSEESKGLVDRVKDLGRQVYLANVGLLALVEEESRKQYEKALEAGKQSHGEGSEWILAARGLVDQLVSEASQIKVETLRTQAQQAREKLLAADLVEQAQKVFQDLVQAGEKRNAA
ncbi:MAG: hypothetical protein HKM02_09990 [Pseudomonadales bacterium]|nr:hypothetical protein [Pseudomonadales bacterium]